jgi:hypothetical protein
MAVEIAKEKSFILAFQWEHLTHLMQTVIAPPALTAQPRLADPRLVAKNFPGKHALDQLLDVILPENTSYKIDNSTFKAIIL